MTGERAQQLCLEYARKNFPGHQVLVCTHTDGHNQSGNIHVHIVINSLRKHDVERQDFMERRGQKKLDTLNRGMTAGGITPRKTKFETQKDFLRNAIEEAVTSARSLEKFQKQL